MGLVSSFRGVSNFSNLKILAPLVPSGLCWCFHNPPNCDMDYWIFDVHYVISSFCTRETSLYSLIPRTFIESAQSLTPEKS